MILESRYLMGGKKSYDKCPKIGSKNTKEKNLKFTLYNKDLLGIQFPLPCVSSDLKVLKNILRQNQFCCLSILFCISPLPPASIHYLLSSLYPVPSCYFIGTQSLKCLTRIQLPQHCIILNSFTLWIPGKEYDIF